MDNENLGYIICEETSTKVEFKIKGEDKAGFVLAEGILQEGNEINRNKRFYPTEELARNVTSARIRELVESGNFKGEAGHPIDTSLSRQAKVDPTLEQVWYTKLWMDGNFVKGQFMGTSNDYGRSFNEDLKRGQKPSFSLRAVGSLVNENGRLTVNKMQMIAYDRVYFPSHSKAYTTNVLTTESANHNKVNYQINESDYFYNKQDEINSIVESGNIVEDVSIDIMQPLTEEEMRLNNFIMSESKNMRLLESCSDIIYDTMRIDDRFDKVNVKTRNGSTIVMPIEEAVQFEIMNSIGKLY